MGLTENKNSANAEIQSLHLRDEAVDSIRDGQYNKRLLSEILADGRVNDMNAMLEAVRHQTMEQYHAEADDLYMRSLELGQVQTEDYFAKVLSDDITEILNDIRECHKKDVTTADETSVAEEVKRGLQEAMSFEGNPQEKQARAYLAALGVDYDAITKEEFVTLIGILQKSRKLQIRQGSQRGKKKRK